MKELTRKYSFELALSQDSGKTWSNQELLNELSKLDDKDGESKWAVWRWKEGQAETDSIVITISFPKNNRNFIETEQLIGNIKFYLHRALDLYSSERNWPTPRLRLDAIANDSSNWSYAITSTNHTSSETSFTPTRLLALGEDSQLSNILGIEALDPIYSLPARWIASSQQEQAQGLGLHLFDVPQLIAYHALSILEKSWHSNIGFLELQRWLVPITDSHGELLARLSPAEIGLLLRTVCDLIKYGLWLPTANQFFNLFLQALGHRNMQNKDDCSELVINDIRKVVAPANINRLIQMKPDLQLIEWANPGADDEDEDAVQKRKLDRLSSALRNYENYEDLIVITDKDCLTSLREALFTCFPGLNTFSWQELPPNFNPRISKVIDSHLGLDPSPWPFKAFAYRGEL